MTTTLLVGVLRHLRRIAPRPDLTDAELVEEFVRRRDEAAFEALMRRHGPMVWGVCRRALRHEADAEDAFQATFLVLVRKAAALADRAAVGNFLYGVAHNVSRKVRAMNRQRHDREQRWAESRPSEVGMDVWRHLRPLLDDELSRLPDKYRAAIVLCDLEGRSVLEAARLLDCPIGTVGSRLARGRQLLGRRLVRHGLALSVGTIGLLLSRHAAEAGAPVSLRPATARTAALVKGVLNGMLMIKVKTTAALVLMACGVGLGWLALGGGGGPGNLPPPVWAAPLPQKPMITPLRVLKEAREAALAAEDKPWKAGMLKAIAKAQAQAGDKEAAAQTFQDAIKAGIGLPEQQAPMWGLAEAQAEAGDLKGARETAGMIGDETQREDALALIAGAQARAGDFEGARRAAEELSAKPRAYSLALSRIALAQAAAGKEEAIQTVAMMNDFDQVCLLSHIAGALTRAKVRDAAKKSLEVARQIAPRVIARDKDYANKVIAEAQAEMGDVKAALQTLEVIAEESLKEMALAKIVAVQARAGDITGALQTAGALSEKKREDLKRDALMAVFVAQLQSGDVKGARQTADTFKGHIYRAWCQARIAAAEAKPADRVPAAAAAFDKAVVELGEGAKGDEAKRLPDFVNREQLQCAMALEQAKAGEAWEAYEWASGQKTPLLKAQALFNVAWGMAQR